MGEDVMSELVVNGTFNYAASELRNKVERFEAELAKLEQVDVPVQHDINGGMYARTGLIPAGTTFTGAVHKKDHINVIMGDITIITDDGPLRLTGYNILPTNAGSKRVAIAHRDTVWTTVIRTDMDNVQDIEDEAVEGSENLQTRKEN